VPDERFQAALLVDPAVDRALLERCGEILACLRVVEALPSYPEQRAVVWITAALNKNEPLLSSTAEALGRLVLARRWDKVLDEIIVRVRRKRADLRPALRICNEMLKLVTRWEMGLATVTADEKWAALADLAAELYSTGPTHHEIWERAGGRNSDLSFSSSGRSAWHTAMGRVRQGGLPTAAALLDKMQMEFPSNDQLRLMATDRDLRGYRR
jgi:hypothetical protein